VVGRRSRRCQTRLLLEEALVSRKVRHLSALATLWFLLWLPFERLARWEGLLGLAAPATPPSLEQAPGEKARCLVVIGGLTHEYDC
jgi:hypothetical protein